ncbi:hypothetical protein L293_0222 [Acinetobacter gyllenbergii CIP 110306 = MTCC 11365]|nr:hypothetical protein L293_0222 [Acinetobacter gyllenbergii CIP 110306 = MTCC 11365]
MSALFLSDDFDLLSVIANKIITHRKAFHFKMDKKTFLSFS